MRVPAAVFALALCGCGAAADDDGVTAPTFAPVTPQATFAPVTGGDDAPVAPTTTAPNETTTTQATSTTAAPSVTAGGVAALVVAPEQPRDGYDRDLFDHWIDEDGDGCDTRCEVLAVERRRDLPGLSGGGWLSVYDGYSTPDSSELDVDHLVALAEAWDSGASAWDSHRRAAFANDMSGLTAVTASVNRSKSDRDPAEWQPPNRDGWCFFAERWVAVKVKWSLTADDAELRALANMLRDC